jgi:hypothetical protein
MKKKINRVCIVNSAYALFLYFLISTEEEIDSTFYFVSDGIPESVRKKLQNIHYFNQKLFGISGQKLMQKSIFALILKCFSRVRWPFLKKSELYGHDHLFFSAGLIGRRQIILIEDGPGDCIPPKRNNFLFLRRWLCGPLVGYNWFGDNPYCKRMILTSSKESGIERDKKATELVNIYELWKKSSQEKQKKILWLFSLNVEDVISLRGKDIILLTQWFSEDEIMTENEKIEMYRMIIKNIDKSKLVIKSHPREVTDYTLFFPDICVFTKKVPMQLLDILGIRFKVAYTVSSTAALSFPYELEKKYFGYGIHPKLINYGKTHPMDSQIVITLENQ